MNATKKQIKQWLDTQIGINIVQHQELVLTDEVTLSNLSRSSRIHINNDAFRLVAKVMELPIEVIDRPEDPNYRYQLQFFYNGEKFIALESEEEYEQNGELE